MDELLGDEGITRAEIEDVIGMLGELPDLWDFVLGSWEDDSVTSRFAREGEQEQYVRGLKQLTTKPVVGVGRFTSPDTMVRMIKSGVLDLIGAARPSIADPFLPKKIETAGSTRSASASAATSASPATSPCRRSAAPRTRPWARSGGAAGIPSGFARRHPTRTSWSSAPARRASRPRSRSATAATR